MINGFYKTIYADPPWWESGGGRIKRGADKHYPLMKTAEIALLPVAKLAALDAHLYLWTTNNFLEDALYVVRAWGFRYITTITWMKDRMGLGQYFRGMTEHCLFAVRGRLPYKMYGDKRAQGKTGFITPKTTHSTKPSEMRAMIERVSYAPRIELFARSRYTGWDAWGDEL